MAVANIVLSLIAQGGHSGDLRVSDNSQVAIGQGVVIAGDNLPGIGYTVVGKTGSTGVILADAKGRNPSLGQFTVDKHSFITIISQVGEVPGSRFRESITLTVAEANAGKDILASALVPAANQVYIEDIQIVVGGATAWSATSSSTKLTISDKSGAPVAMVDATLAALTANAILLRSTSGVTLKAAAITGSTAGFGLSIRSDGTHDVVAGSTLTIVVSGRIL